MKKETVRKSIIYTSTILNKLYNLKTAQIKYLNDGTSYASDTVTFFGNKYEVGLYTESKSAHILSSEEILIIDILLCWKKLLDADDEDISITFNDIDWLRNRNTDNAEHIRKIHQKYISIISLLNKLYFIMVTEPFDELEKCKEKYKLMMIDWLYDDNEVIGFKYNLNELGNLLEEANQVSIIYNNVFNYRLNEDMNYRLLRYLVSAIFMNRVKGKSFSRTHKSILLGITYHDSDGADSYYNNYLDQKFINKYLKRYLSRLNEVLCRLKESGYIKDYVIENISNKRELTLGFGMVTIFTNLSRRQRK